MNCWHCSTELIWGGDHDIEEEDDTYVMVTNLSCPTCHSHVDVYYPSEQTQKEYEQLTKDK
jgi:Zn finger protein HypA/HybF involved in hydrogenase expression